MPAAETDKAAFMREAAADIRAREAAADPRILRVSTVCIPCPFADFDFYYTRGVLRWTPNPGQTLAPVVVPEGFCTDLASVPQLFWSVYPKTGRYAYAAIAHDFLYWTQGRPRGDADNVLYTAMEDTEVATATKLIIYGLVDQFGQSSWDANTAAKAAGEKRFLKVLPPADRITSWAAWKSDPAHFSA